jgi:hypothetical protein
MQVGEPAVGALKVRKAETELEQRTRGSDALAICKAESYASSG